MLLTTVASGQWSQALVLPALGSVAALLILVGRPRLDVRAKSPNRTRTLH